MRAYALLLTQKNDNSKLFSPKLAGILRRHNAGVVMSGYDPIIYAACLVFAYKAERDQCAAEVGKLGIDYETRDDAIIPDGYL